MIARTRARILAVGTGLSLALSGCVSLGGAEPPDSLLTLTSAAAAPAGSGAVAGGEDSEGAIAVLAFTVPAKLNTLRVPVDVSDTEIAYLQEAVWVEKPQRLFRRLLGETLRTKGAGFVLDNDDTPILASQFVRGTLLDMTFDARSNSVVVRFEAVVTDESGTVRSRRFEAREPGVLPEAASVGPALNRAANSVAGEIADWVISGS